MSAQPTRQQRAVSRRVRLQKARARGQVAIIIAVSMLVLMAIVGLAVDGGSMYAQRRAAQNSADAAALAATRTMLNAYEQMIYDNPTDVDGSPNDEGDIDNALTTYANL